jgi:tRNA(Ile)-lysidine synthase
MIRTSSHKDAEFVRRICSNWGIPLILEQRDVPQYCQKHKMNLEEGARDQRYDFLFSTAEKINAKAVLIAHHADDQVETVLMHFIRGAGLSGLKGMLPKTTLQKYSTTIPLIRPLLNINRQQIDVYCRENQVPYVDDETNKDTAYFRNRLRHDLIPLMETYNPCFREVLIRSTHSLQEDASTIDELTTESWSVVLKEKDFDHIILDIHQLAGISRGIRWNIFRKAVHALRPDIRDFNFDVLIRLEKFFESSIVGKIIELANHLEARLTQKGLIICDSRYKEAVVEFPQYMEPGIILNIPLKKQLSNGWNITGRIVEFNNETGFLTYTPNNNEGWLDHIALSGEISLRTYQSGDRIQPLGNEGHHAKVSDIFINRKIPVEARSGYPVICDETGIIWLPGIMISERCKITRETKKILHLTISKVQ